MELLVSLNKKELDDYLQFTNSFIIGLENYAVNYYEASLDDIEKMLAKYPGISLFVSINKNIFNKDLKDLEEKLISLSKLPIKGVLFYDLSVLEIVSRLKLKIDLGIHQTHLITNYNICEYYFEQGVKYGYLATEITALEMAEIKEKTKLKLMAYFVGHPIISHSKRKLVSNYYEYIKKKKTKDLNIINEKDKEQKYYIQETKLGTNVLTYDILNGTKAFLVLKDKLSYGILDNQLIPDDLFLKVLKLYKLNLDNSISDLELTSKVQELIGDKEGFFFLKTIYKVK